MYAEHGLIGKYKVNGRDSIVVSIPRCGRVDGSSILPPDNFFSSSSFHWNFLVKNQDSEDP